MELEDHDGLAIVRGEVVHEQVVDEIAPQTAGDLLPFEVRTSAPPIPMVSSPAPPRARFDPPPSSSPSAPARPTTRVVAVPAIEAIRVGIAKQPILAAASDDHLETTQRVALAGRSATEAGEATSAAAISTPTRPIRARAIRELNTSGHYAMRWVRWLAVGRSAQFSA